MVLKWMPDVGGKIQYLNWDKFNGLVYLKRFRIFLADKSFTFPIVSPRTSNYCSIRSYLPVSCIVFAEKLIIVLKAAGSRYMEISLFLHIPRYHSLRAVPLRKAAIKGSECVDYRFCAFQLQGSPVRERCLPGGGAGVHVLSNRP